ncbi:FAD-dependent oxidoreductase [Thermoflexus sp.]|uniref:FAD-dependent oxidoreductase n=1 Tax=Thermoflexus sp. TaxID=1969742 RepID=UPI0035E45F2A
MIPHIPGDEFVIERKVRTRLLPVFPAERPPEARRFDFAEVLIGYDEATAPLEAARCLHCPDPAPCIQACPLHNDIPTALWFIEQGDFLRAAQVFRQTSFLSEICGRVCPPQTCRGSCTLSAYGKPINITKLEAFVADFQRRQGALPIHRAPPTGRRAAVVGSGPAGLTVAEFLARQGHSVTVFEAMPKPGGLLRYGIPAFKLPKAVIDQKVTDLEALGVQFITGVRIGQDLTLDDLFAQGYQAIFLGVGTWRPVEPDWEGANLEGVYMALDFLMRANLPLEDLPPEKREPPRVGRRVAVIGGGDTAMDCARTAIRLGAEEVTIYYRRSEAEMPGNREERKKAREEGVRFEFLVAPLRFLGEGGRLTAIEFVRMALGEPDESGRRRPVPIPGSNFIVSVDAAVLALGFRADPTIVRATPGLEASKGGLLRVDAEGRTSRPGVFAAGDGVTGPDLVVTASAAAMRAARAMHAYLMEQPPIEEFEAPALAEPVPA